MQSERKELEAKRTPYGEYKFRSRNEAKWAVFFDYMGIEYRYENSDVHDGYRRVLPDFYLPKVGIFIEVKHENFSDDMREEHVGKYSIIPSTTGKPCMIAYGDPRSCASHDTRWNKSILLFNGIKATPTGDVFASDEVKLYRSRCWFANYGADDSFGFYGNIELATDIDKNKFHIVSKSNDKWEKIPMFSMSNPYNRIVEQVALFARQFQFEYTEEYEHPAPDSDEASEVIRETWRSKYPPKAIYAGTHSSTVPSWAN